MDYYNDFKMAADNDLTCSDCKHCQIHVKKAYVRDGYLCMREDSKQSGYYSPDWMVVNEDFLCNKFELYQDD
jgi:hypothetical protein